MSLFDNRDLETTQESSSWDSWDNFDFIEEGAKGKNCADGDCDDDSEPDTEPDAEPADDKAADNDAEASTDKEKSLKECVGCPAINDAEEQNHFYTLEAMAIQMAFDRTDVACTESYTRAESEMEQEMVTENFKETVKKFWERFKGFLGKVRNMIVRVAQRFAGYVKQLYARVLAKWASRDANIAKIGENRFNKDIKVTVYSKLVTTDIGALGKEVVGSYATEMKAIEDASNAATANAEEAKKTLSDLKIAEKSDVLKNIVGEEKEVTVGSLGVHPKALIDSLKKLKDAIKTIDQMKKGIATHIDKTENRVKSMKDIDSAVMSVQIAAVNKAVSIYNRKLALLNQVLVMWVSSRARVLNAIGKYKAPKEEAASESMSFFDDMMSML